MRRKSVSIAVAATLAAASAQAAQLTNVQGNVQVNNGGGFKPVAGFAEVSPGDRIKVVNGSADIIYGNGCTVKIRQGQVVAVLWNAPGCGGGLKDGPAAEAGLSTETAVIGGVAIAAGAGLAVALSNDPASP
jgi:hypothetical protein